MALNQLAHQRLVPQGTLARAVAFGIASGVATLLIIGVPTDVLANPWFARVVPVRALDYMLLGLTTLLAAALGASYAFPARCALRPGRLTLGGALSYLAVGCPVCNKLVVLLLGVGGALTYFQPLQPVLGLVSVLLLTVALLTRLRAIRPLHARTPTV